MQGKKKKNRIPKTCGPIANGLTYLQTDEKGNKAEEILQEIMTKHFPKLMKDKLPNQEP